MAESEKKESVWTRARAMFSNRKLAYLRTFDPKSQSARVVLEDLARFCRANETAFHADPRLHAVLEGRREVWLRIQNHLNLSADELFELTKQRKGEV